MHNQDPKVLSAAEWSELATIRDVREDFGLQNGEGGAQLSRYAYAAKFNFMSGSPGYFGDVYILFGDGLSAPPMVFIRLNGGIERAEF